MSRDSSPRQCDALIEDGSNREVDVCDVDHARSLVTIAQGAVGAAGWRAHPCAAHAGGTRQRDGASTPRRSAFATCSKAINGLLFVRATQLHRGDSLLFLTEEEQASMLALMWRYGAPAVLLLFVLIALALWRAGVRFGPLVGADRNRATFAGRADSRHRTVRAALRRRRRAACRDGARAARRGAATSARLRPPVERRTRRRGRASSAASPPSELGPALNYSGRAQLARAAQGHRGARNRAT